MEHVGSCPGPADGFPVDGRAADQPAGGGRAGNVRRVHRPLRTVWLPPQTPLLPLRGRTLLERMELHVRTRRTGASSSLPSRSTSWTRQFRISWEIRGRYADNTPGGCAESCARSQYQEEIVEVTQLVLHERTVEQNADVPRTQIQDQFLEVVKNIPLGLSSGPRSR